MGGKTEMEGNLWNFIPGLATPALTQSLGRTSARMLRTRRLLAQNARKVRRHPPRQVVTNQSVAIDPLRDDHGRVHLRGLRLRHARSPDWRVVTNCCASSARADGEWFIWPSRTNRSSGRWRSK